MARQSKNSERMIPKICCDFSADEATNSSLGQLDRSMQEILVPQEGVEVKPQRSNTYTLGPSHWDTSPQLSSPETTRRDSCSLSIQEDLLDNFLPNVDVYLTPSIAPGKHTKYRSPHLPRLDFSSLLSPEGIEDREDFIKIIESDIVDDPGPGTPTEANPNDVLECAQHCQLANYGSPAKVPRDSKVPREKYPTPHPKAMQKPLKSLSTASSTLALNLDDTYDLRPSHNSIDSDIGIDRCQSALGFNNTKFSFTTRSTPDISKAGRSQPRKVITKYPKSNYSHVKSKVKQYKEELDRLCPVPKTSKSQPSQTTSTTSVNTSEPGSNRGTSPKAISAGDIPRQTGVIPKIPQQPASRPGTLDQPTQGNTRIAAHSTSPVNPNSTDRVQRSSLSSFDALTQKLWDRVDLLTKEKRVYKDQLESLEKQFTTLENYTKGLEEAYYAKKCPVCESKKQVCEAFAAALHGSGRRTSTSSTGTNWIDSSTSEDTEPSQNPNSNEFKVDEPSTSYHGMPARGTALYEEGNTDNPDSLASSTQLMYQPRPSTEHGIPSVTHKPSVVMGTRHMLSKSRKSKACPTVSDQERELDRAAEIAFGPLPLPVRPSPAQLPMDNAGMDAAMAILQVSGSTEVVEPPSRQLSVIDISDDDGEFPKHLSRLIWKAGFFLNKTATGLLPEVQPALNLDQKDKFVAQRKSRTEQTKVDALSKLARRKKKTALKSTSTLASESSSVASMFSARFRAPSRPSKNRRRSKSCERLPSTNKYQDVRALMEFLEVAQLLSGSLAAKSKALSFVMGKDVKFLRSLRDS